MGSEHCVCCGAEIPEGSMVCPICDYRSRAGAPDRYTVSETRTEAVNVLGEFATMQEAARFVDRLRSQDPASRMIVITPWREASS